MSKSRLPLVVLLALQVIAFVIYPLSYFQREPQSAVMPPALLVLFILAIVGLNTGTLSMEGTRSLMIFIQGINLITRAMTLFPNLKTPTGEWSWALLFMQVLGMALSWYTMTAMEHQPLHALRFRATATSQQGESGTG